MTRRVDTNEVAGEETDDALDAQHAAAIVEEAGRQARRELQVAIPCGTELGD